jgi:putative transposase
MNRIPRSRKVVGWALGERMTKELVISAMNQTVQQEQLAEGAIFHSDRGSQYAFYGYQALLKQHGILQSMSRKGDCYDNACAESFFATLKKELIHRNRFKTRFRAIIEVIFCGTTRSDYTHTWITTRRWSLRKSILRACMHKWLRCYNSNSANSTGKQRFHVFG